MPEKAAFGTRGPAEKSARARLIIKKYLGLWQLNVPEKAAFGAQNHAARPRNPTPSLLRFPHFIKWVYWRLKAPGWGVPKGGIRHSKTGCPFTWLSTQRASCEPHIRCLTSYRMWNVLPAKRARKGFSKKTFLAWRKQLLFNITARRGGLLAAKSVWDGHFRRPKSGCPIT